MNYTITFADGTILNNLVLNGNNFISQNPITSDFFTAERLLEVTITDSENNTQIIENARLVACQEWPDGYYFILREMTDLEKLEFIYNSKLDYLAAMTGVDLDE